MKKLVGLLMLVRAVATLAILGVFILAINATWGYLQNARAHLSAAGEEVSLLAGDLQSTGQSLNGVFKSVSDSAEDIADVLDQFPELPTIQTTISIEVPQGAIRNALASFPIPTSLTSSTSLLNVIENNTDIDIPFASEFNAFKDSFNPLVDDLKVTFENIETMGDSLDVVSSELQLANNELLLAVNALDDLPFNLGQYLPTLIIAFIGLWLVTAFLVDIQRGAELLFE